MTEPLIRPDWPAPAGVRAFTTTRALGDLRQGLDVLQSWLPAAPTRLEQVHGTTVAHLPLADAGERPRADAAVTRRRGVVCMVLHADCLPVVLCNRAGDRVGVAHAGWRGLAAGVLEASVNVLGGEAGDLVAWLGPAIGPGAFEVGADVYEAFTRDDPGAAEAFTGDGPKWHADLYALARLRLGRAGVGAVHGGEFCTFRDAERFFSYRRDARRDGASGGRMATCAWLEPA